MHLKITADLAKLLPRLQFSLDVARRARASLNVICSSGHSISIGLLQMNFSFKYIYYLSGLTAA